MYMDVDEVAYPEGHTLWDKVAVPNASKLTLGGFVDLFKSEHKLVLQELMLTVGDKSQMIYSVTLAQLAATSEANLARPLVELIGETTKKNPNLDPNPNPNSNSNPRPDPNPNPNSNPNPNQVRPPRSLSRPPRPSTRSPTLSSRRSTATTSSARRWCCSSTGDDSRLSRAGLGQHGAIRRSRSVSRGAETRGWPMF